MGARLQRRDLTGLRSHVYFFLVRDLPGGKMFQGAKKTEPMKVTSYGDLVQYLVWSVPSGGSDGHSHLAVCRVCVSAMSRLLGPGLVWVIYAVLAADLSWPTSQKTLQVNLPVLRAGVPDEERYHWGSVAALNSTYFANFGAELAVVSMLPMFFESTFRNLRAADGSYIMTATVAGHDRSLVRLCESLCATSGWPVVRHHEEPQADHAHLHGRYRSRLCRDGQYRLLRSTRAKMAANRRWCQPSKVSGG